MRSSIVAPVSSRESANSGALDEPLELSLFGTLAARRGGHAIALRLPDQALRLLCYLLLHRERIQPREQVAFTLWPDDDEADARANLRRKLHLIQRALPAARKPWIITTNSSVGWNAESTYKLDVEVFESLLRADALNAADDLYRGELLAGFDDEWIARERERFATLATSNLMRLIARAQKNRDYSAAIACAQRVRTIDPWREDAVRTLITLRYESGDRAGALTEYERFRAALGDEMGVEPMPETVCVYDLVVANAAATSTNEPRPADALHHVHLLPFVAREREFEQLQTAWTAASDGTGSALMVVGEAGIGKTRLIEEFATFVQSNGGRILRGSATPFELAPYQPFSEAFGAALPILREARIKPLWLSVLATLVPGLQHAYADLAPPAALASEPERNRLFEAVDVAIAALSTVRPTVLLLEDLHWAGSTTISLFEYLAQHAANHRIVILASYREDELQRLHPLRAARRRLERERRLRILALGPLGAASIEQIVTQVADEGPEAQNEIVRYLLQSSDGNPFFLSELVANDRETGFFDAAARRWHRHGNSIEAMLSLTSMLRVRLERLSPQARSVAEIAAVIGRSFSAELVREVSGVDERAIRDNLDELIDRRIVRDIDAAGIDFAFSHHLLQQVAYTEMSIDARRLRHRRVGTVMEELYSEQLEDFAAELASHFDRGGEPEHAAQHYALAARHALALYGAHEAESLAARGNELSRDTLTEFLCTDISEEAARRLGNRDAQRAHVERLEMLAQGIGDPQLLRQALQRRIELAHDCGDLDEERAALTALGAQIPGAPVPWPAIFAQLRGSYLTAIGSYTEARAVLEDSLERIAEHDHPKLFVDCRCALVRLACFEGRSASVRVFLEDIDKLENSYDATLTITLLETACTAASMIHENTALAASAERLMNRARAIGYNEGEAMANRFAGQAAFALFEIDQARTFFSRAVEMFASMGQRLNQLHTYCDLGILAASIGRFDEAITSFQTASDIAKLTSYDFGRVACLNNISVTAHFKGEFAVALSSAKEALDLANGIGAPSARAHALVNLGVAERELNDLDAAVLHLSEGTAIQRDLGQTDTIGEDLSELCWALLRKQEFQRAQEVAQEALQFAEATTSRPSRPQFILWTAAAVYRSRGDGDRARVFLFKARSQLDLLESAISDNESRATFRNLAYNRAIDDAFVNDHWPI